MMSRDESLTRRYCVPVLTSSPCDTFLLDKQVLGLCIYWRKSMRLAILSRCQQRQTIRGGANSLTKLTGSTFMTAWCLTAFVALGWHSATGPTFASSRPAQTSIIKASQKPPSTAVNSGVTVEEFSFLIKDFKIEHQGETNNLNITIQYRYRVNIAVSEYPDFRVVAKDIEMFLTNYPNEKDYWELLNKRTVFGSAINCPELGAN